MPTRTTITALTAATVIATLTGCTNSDIATLSEFASNLPTQTTTTTTDSSSTGTASPPGIPDPARAETMLNELKVAEDGSMDGYDRDKFPTWADQGENCDTREAVLKRDGEGVEVGDDCYPTSGTGTWISQYDGKAWSKPSDVDIDHVVPLAVAYRSGAAEWSQEDREAFANDMESPQLIAVTDEVNQEKSDQTPVEWMPPEQGYHCTYASMWIASKHKWKLTINESEKTALTEALGTC